MAIHRYLGERCLRTQAGGYLAPDVHVSPEIMKASPQGAVEGFLNWVGDDARFIPARDVENQLKSNNPMLQADEHVGMAYKVGRDMLVFTTKRLLIVDVQGWSGKKVEWKSIPYTAIRAFAVQSAGSWDRDAEVFLYTKTYWINGGPGSVFQQDLRKGKSDIIAMQAYLAAQIMGRDDGAAALPPPVDAEPPSAPAGVGGFLEWVGNDAHEISVEDTDRQLHENPRILQEDEKVEKALKIGRDMFIFTSKRVLWIDVKGWSGQRVLYMSYPLKYMYAFQVQSAGAISFILSAHAAIYSDIPGARKVEHDLSKSKVDIWDIQAHMMKKLL
jgi:hypothetical protein